MAGNISILDIGPVIFGNTEELMDFVQQKHLLPFNMVCSNCGTAMTLRQKSDISVMAASFAVPLARPPSC